MYPKYAISTYTIKSSIHDFFMVWNVDFTTYYNNCFFLSNWDQNTKNVCHTVQTYSTLELKYLFTNWNSPSLWRCSKVRTPKWISRVWSQAVYPWMNVTISFKSVHWLREFLYLMVCAIFGRTIHRNINVLLVLFPKVFFFTLWDRLIFDL